MCMLLHGLPAGQLAAEVLQQEALQGLYPAPHVPDRQLPWLQHCLAGFVCRDRVRHASCACCCMACLLDSWRLRCSSRKRCRDCTLRGRHRSLLASTCSQDNVFGCGASLAQFSVTQA